jgi:hypothetical protein
LLSRAKGQPGRDPLDDALVAAAGDTRYWKLTNVVEASLAVLDIALLPQEPGPITPQPVVPTKGRRCRSTRKIEVDKQLGKLEAKMRRELTRELGSESAAEAALVEQLYSLSAEDLVPMLKRIGFTMSAKTIRRPKNSPRYKSWERYRKPSAPIAADADVGPAALSDTRPPGTDAAVDTLREWRSAAGLSDVRSRASDVADDAVNSGHLSRRTGGRGTTRIGKTAAERADEAAADKFARDAGAELPPAE